MVRLNYRSPKAPPLHTGVFHWVLLNLCVRKLEQLNGEHCWILTYLDGTNIKTSSFMNMITYAKMSFYVSVSIWVWIGFLYFKVFDGIDPELVRKAMTVCKGSNDLPELSDTNQSGSGPERHRISGQTVFNRALELQAVVWFSINIVIFFPLIFFL